MNKATITLSGFTQAHHYEIHCIHLDDNNVPVALEDIQTVLPD